MTRPLEDRLRDALAGSPFADRIATSGAPFLERRADDAAAAALDGAVLIGLARVLASQPKAAGFLSHRPALLERIAHSGPDTLAQRGAALRADEAIGDPEDLEASLDTIRILRREETCLAACLDLGGVVNFAAVSEFLSLLAEAVTHRTLELAGASANLATDADHRFAVIGMGKIAGREFTYHSDLDLIFLYAGGTGEIDRVSRAAQRLITYLGTMTGAGMAYAVDTRLRPSGQQGSLVTTYESFDRYQRESAQTWEHVALLRARAIAGAVDFAQPALDAVRRGVLGSGRNAWRDLAGMRAKVEAERGAETEAAVPIKTGRGGLMDADFLAGGGVLERGADSQPDVPSVPAMLRRATAERGCEALIDDYASLRRLEARCRWLRSRAAEHLETNADSLACAAELFEPGLDGPGLLERVSAVRRRIRNAYDAVIEAESIEALAAAQDAAAPLEHEAEAAP